MSFLEVTLDLLEGFGTSLGIFAVTLVVALPLGVLICAGSISRFKIVKSINRTLVWIIRGTPLLLQILIINYAPGIIMKIYMPPSYALISVLIAFGINYAAYFSEIYRGGVEAIPKGQYEAGYLLGMTKSQTFVRIIVPQLYKIILPPMGNEFMTLVKDTSLARVIGVVELFWVAENFTTKGMIWPLFYTGVFYLTMCGILTILFSYLEKRSKRWA